MKCVTIVRLLAAIGVLLAATAAYPQGHSQHQQHDTAGAQQGSHGIAPPGPGASPFEKEMYRAMEQMMVNMHAPGYTGNWDIDFLAMMIPHHQGAIDMARLVLMYGEDPPTRSLASEIIASQQAEIDAMKARLAILKEKGRDPGPGEYPSLTGTRGSSSMASFAAVKGNRIELKVGDEVYACSCGEGCACDTISREPGKCPCGADLVKARVTKVEEGKAFLKADGWPKERAFKTEGKFICGCGPACHCDTISQKPGKCPCGTVLKEYGK